VLSAGETSVEVLCVIDPEQPGRRCGGLVIVPDLEAAMSRLGTRSLDGIIVTDTRIPQANFDNLRSVVELNGLPADCVVAPSLLRISPLPVRAIGEAAQ